MSRIILITGPMRSGTSLVAQIVHHLGFQVAPTIPAPAPPSWRSDWEDPDLTVKLLRGQRINWVRYVEGRKHLAEAMGFRGAAMKSPFLARHLKEIVRDELIYLIVTSRGEADTRRSLQAHPQLKEAWQTDIRQALKADWPSPDMRLRYEDIIHGPQYRVCEIARALGVDDEDAIERAIAIVGKPTEYPCLQSSPQ